MNMLEENAEQDSAQTKELDRSRAQQGWTFGDSNALSPHAAPESKWVSAAWIVVPTLLALIVVAMMATL